MHDDYRNVYAQFFSCFTAEYPFINYFVIHQARRECHEIFRQIRSHVFETTTAASELNAAVATATGGAHRRIGVTVDLYEETATIARPPVEPLSRKPTTESTGYIVCVYKVFRGDDGEKFERNWLYWTGESIRIWSISVTHLSRTQ